MIAQNQPENCFHIEIRTRKSQAQNAVQGSPNKEKTAPTRHSFMLNMPTYELCRESSLSDSDLRNKREKSPARAPAPLSARTPATLFGPPKLNGKTSLHHAHKRIQRSVRIRYVDWIFDCKNRAKFIYTIS